jgi:hypothetical protein
MRIPVKTAFLWSLAITAGAQSRLEISMPPDSRQAGRLTFANSCPTHQLFQVTAQPQVPWLSFDRSTVDADAGTSFDVQITTNTFATGKLGSYQSSVVVVCSTCAANEQPCFLNAQAVPIRLKVADIKTAGEFEWFAKPAPTTPADPGGSRPDESGVPSLMASDPSKTPGRFIPLAGGGLLAIGVAGALLAAKEKLSLRRAENERYR